ncbi:unnamed protein product, partial [Prorocentrum cordatum]
LAADLCSDVLLCNAIESAGFTEEGEAEVEKMSSKAVPHVEPSRPREKPEGLARRLDGARRLFAPFVLSATYLYTLVFISGCVSTPNDYPTVQELGHTSGHFLAKGPILTVVALFGKTMESGAKLKAAEALFGMSSTRPPTAVTCEEKGNQTIPLGLVGLGDVARICASGCVLVEGSACSDVVGHTGEVTLTVEHKPVSTTSGFK